MILLIDNYDSFVHNLARYFQRLGQTTQVVRNDATDVPAIRELAPQAIVLSPGPCTPAESGCSVEVVRELNGSIPILGICLGHQAIAAAFGGRIVHAPQPMHGRTSSIQHDETGVFQDVPNPVTVCRYHSLIADRKTLPATLQVIAWTHDGTIMGLKHRDHLTVGLQFHPEAVLTEFGFVFLRNFLQLAGLCRGPAPDMLSEVAALKKTGPPLPSGPVTF